MTRDICGFPLALGCLLIFEGPRQPLVASRIFEVTSPAGWESLAGQATEDLPLNLSSRRSPAAWAQPRRPCLRPVVIAASGRAPRRGCGEKLCRNWRGLAHLLEAERQERAAGWAQEAGEDQRGAASWRSSAHLGAPRTSDPGPLAWRTTPTRPPRSSPRALLPRPPGPGGPAAQLGPRLPPPRRSDSGPSLRRWPLGR